MAETYNEKADILIKKTFAESFERLMEIKEFEDITTSQIIAESGLSRSTFYRHFKDKFELAAWECIYIHRGEHRKPKTVEDGDENIKNLVYTIDEKRHVYKKLFKYKGQNSFGDFFKLFSDQFVKEIAIASDRELSLKEMYVNRYHCMGCLAVLNEWILSDAPLSREEILDIVISESRSPAVRKLYLSK